MGRRVIRTVNHVDDLRENERAYPEKDARYTVKGLDVIFIRKKHGEIWAVTGDYMMHRITGPQAFELQLHQPSQENDDGSVQR